MPNLNLCVLMGHIGKDVEVKYTSKGSPYCKISLATSSGLKDKQVTQWHNITIWGSKAELMADAKKGDIMRVTGQIQYRKYEENIYTEIVADMVDYQAKKKDEDNDFIKE